MNIVEFQDIVDAVIKNPTAIRFVGKKREYVGIYNGTKAKVILNNSIDRCVVINGWRYYLNYTKKELKGERL
jgi:hypothetical protein